MIGTLTTGIKDAIARVLRLPRSDAAWLEAAREINGKLASKPSPELAHAFGPMLAEEILATTARLEAARQRAAAERTHPDNRGSLRERVHQLEARTRSPLLGEDLEADLEELEEVRRQLSVMEGLHYPADQIEAEAEQLEHRLACLRAVEARVAPADLTDQALATEADFWPSFVERAYYAQAKSRGSARGDVAHSEWLAARARREAVKQERSSRAYDRQEGELVERWADYERRRAEFRARLAELTPEALELGREYDRLQEQTRRLQGLANTGKRECRLTPGPITGRGLVQRLRLEAREL